MSNSTTVKDQLSELIKEYSPKLSDVHNNIDNYNKEDFAKKINKDSNYSYIEKSTRKNKNSSSDELRYLYINPIELSYEKTNKINNDIKEIKQNLKQPYFSNYLYNYNNNREDFNNNINKNEENCKCCGQEIKKISLRNKPIINFDLNENLNLDSNKLYNDYSPVNKSVTKRFFYNKNYSPRLNSDFFESDPDVKKRNQLENYRLNNQQYNYIKLRNELNNKEFIRFMEEMEKIKINKLNQWKREFLADNYLY
jgi:hypothetical protein